MSQKKDGQQRPNPLRDILVPAEIKTDGKSIAAVPKRIAMWALIVAVAVSMGFKAEPTWERIVTAWNAPDEPTSKFDTTNNTSENSVAPAEGGVDCPVKDNHEIDGLTNVTASADVLENKDAGPLNVRVTSDMTITIQSGTFSFGPESSTPPPFKIQDMREGFTAEGKGILIIHRCS